ncbi:hypothetical protein E2C01_077438 [Portunus trituberculatus]|uniref:Uncharacterized protein n=1 Tax=Portunus trituberculatus TaxID=210409 RepID=A0A5B7IMA1_PORTR|nr:hypothetical protein [Portunus trituberculatus]
MQWRKRGSDKVTREWPMGEEEMKRREGRERRLGSSCRWSQLITHALATPPPLPPLSPPPPSPN